MIIEINEEKCVGCGLCTSNCAEGAIKVIDGKAKLISDSYCDGLGKCLPHCPMDALQLVEREAKTFSHDEVESQNQETPKKEMTNLKSKGPMGGGCPGSRMMCFDEPVIEKTTGKIDSGDVEISIKPQLRQWPVQLKLVSPNAPYFENADLLVTADCVPFAYPNYHLDLLKGKAVVVGCPKLDDIQYYTEKLTEIISNNSLKSITVAFMEVPCCQGIVRAVDIAVSNANKNIPVNKVKISVQGQRV